MGGPEDLGAASQPVVIRTTPGARQDLPPSPAGACGTTNRLHRVWQHRSYYARLMTTGLRAGQRPTDLVRTQAARRLPVGPRPPTVAVELTNRCNLRCPYCTSTVSDRPRGLMATHTVERVAEEVAKTKVGRVSLIGNGEPTLHPHFAEHLQLLAGATPMVTLTSNWTRADDEVVDAVVRAPVRMLNVSVDGADHESYARSRVNGDIDDVVHGLERLRAARARARSRYPVINVRLMVRPSQEHRVDEQVAFWQRLGDEVQLQHVVDASGAAEDVYALRCAPERFPRCELPFKLLDVRWNGDVPLCVSAYIQAGDPHGPLLGSIDTDSITDLWSAALITQYRQGQRDRDESLMPLCQGCSGN